MLVPDYSSSSDSESDTEPIQQIKKRPLSSLLPPPKKTKLIHIELPKLQDDHEEEYQSKPLKSTSGLGLADLLPAPKNYKGPVPVTQTTTAFMPHALSKKMKGKEKQVAPKPEQKEEQQQEEEEEQEEEGETQGETAYVPKKSFFHIGNICRHVT